MRAMDWSASPLGDPTGWPQSLRAVVSLILNSRFPMFVAWGPKLGFLYNDAYAAILGPRHPDAIGLPFRDIWPEIWSDIGPLVDRALAGEASFSEDLPLLMRRRGYDEQTWFTFSYSPVRDESGSVGGMYCACTETTSQVLSARGRVAEIERLRALFAQAPGFMAVLSGKDHVVDLANEAYQQVVGRRDLLGKPIREALPDLAGQGLFELLDQVYATGQRVIGRARPISLRRSGDLQEELFVDFVYEPMRDATGAVTGIFVQGNDVTELVRALSKMRASDQRKDEFLAMLAHELRNPLSPISSAARLLQLRSSEDTVRRASEIIARQVGHMSKLVDDLLDVSRVTRGLIQLDRVALRVDDVVDRAVEQVRPQVEARRQRLVVGRGGADLGVRGDPTRITQILSNLLVNASKFSPAGGAITVAVSTEAREVTIAVRDEGIGIPAEALPNVFELFTQVDPSPDRARGGLGLGLALVRSLVELHGGRVEARSEGPGAGAEFTVRLPRSSPGPDPAPAELPRRPGARLRVLVVDDNVDAAETLVWQLRADGHLVEVAHDAAAALARAPRLSPQVMVLDIGLPDTDGYALARLLRAMPETSSATLIALTGYGQEPDRRRALEAGFDHHLVKPADGRLLDLLRGLPG